MRKINRLGILLLLFSITVVNLISLIPVTTFAEEASWIPFVSRSEPNTRLQVLPKSADTMGLMVDSSFYGMYNIETTINETLFNVLSIPGAGYTGIIGKPAVPVTTRFLEVPDNVNINVEVVYRDEQILEGFNVIPTQEDPVDYPNASQPLFAFDETTYTTDAFYPSEITSIEGAEGADSITIRGHRIVPLSLYPVQFNPVTKQLRVYSKIEVRLNYDVPGQVEPLSPRLDSPAFESLLEALVLNYQYRGTPNYTQVKLLASNYFAKAQTDSEAGAEYLIITHDDFYSNALNLAAWKEQKGLTTKIVNTTQINSAGPTANDITAYIQNAYDTWTTAPSYLLLLGDSEFIPPHYRTPHYSTSHGNFHTPTDLYYATVDGNDFFPDIYVGRLSVDTPQQAEIVIAKIVDYESNPPATPAFYTDVSAAAFFQDNDPQNGREDRGFVFTSEEIRDFLMAQGYNVDRIYTTDGVNPTDYGWPPYGDGSPLPAALLTPVFGWNGATADITNAINAGRFLVYHRDHGASTNFWDHDTGNWGVNVDGWGDPLFENGDIAGLANNPLFPVVFSVNCQTGWFDGEVDQNDDPSLTRNVESFCEEFVRHQNGGAIATIGATRNTPSYRNDDLLRGFIDAIWPGFDPSRDTGGLYNLGQVLTYGKIYMLTLNPYSTRSNATFELYHLFGDPELSIWTEEPRTLAVSHPLQIGSNGYQKFVVNVTDQLTGVPVNQSKVCLQKGTGIHEVAYTDPAGAAYFSVYPTSGGDMTITATKHNYEPYEGSITVTGGGAVLSVNPTVGPRISINLQGSNFDGNEQVDIYFGGSTVDATFAATSGSFTGTFTVPAGQIGPLNVRAVGKSSGRWAVAVFRRLPDQPLPDPYIYDQWDSSTWHLNPAGGDPRWNNPCIQLYDAASGVAVASNNLEVGTTYTVKAIIYNDATVDAVDTDVTFQWAFWGQGQRNWYSMGSDTITVPANNVAAVAETTWTPSITGHSCIQASIYHPWDENTDNNIGQENTDVHPVASPGEITFTVNNPTDRSALVYIEAKQVGTQDLWETRIEREYPQIQAPGENKTATLIVDAPPDADEGETRIFTVSGYVNGELIGGIEVEVVVDRSGQVNWCLVFLILIVVLIVVILFLIRRRGWKEKLLGIIIIAIAIILYLLRCVLKIWA